MEQSRQKISDLSPEQRAQLEKRLLQRRRKTTGSNTIPRRDTLTPCPTSFAQQRLWFLDQFLRGSAAYNIARAYRLQGPLNTAALEHSFDEIIRCQESLRTTFSLQDGEPVQVIHPAVHNELAVTDLSTLQTDTQEAEVQRLLQEETRTGFDLEQGPLLRIRLLRLDTETHILSLVLHHVISDGWSQGVLIRELTALYNATLHGQPSPLPELPVQYADFSIWQKNPEQSCELEKQLDYWKQQLSGLAPLELPTDRPHQAVQTLNGATEYFEIPAPLTEKLKVLSQQAGGTLYMTLLAAVHILLQRYCGTNDVATGSPIAGRSRTELEGLIGFFINTLVMRTDLSGNPTFMELFGRVREMALGAYTHQDLPFEKLVETLLPERDLSKNPLFQVMFVLQNAPTTELQLEGLVSSRVKTILESAKFDLTIELTEQQAGLRGRINYNTDLFDKNTIVRMVSHLQTLLEGITENPESPISKLPLLTDTERHQLQFDWNQTQTAYPREQTITTLFESQVEHTPDAVALEFGKEQLTYSELNTRANRLAHYLQARGVGPEVMVAVCVERSIEMVVGLLGILKAGGAYVPLAPDYPQKRLEFMIEDTGAPLLLTQSSLRASLPAFSGEVVLLDTDWPAIERESGDNPVSATTPASLMYIIYTSGSTGRPKGVCVEHHSAVRLVKNTNYVELGFDEVFLQFAPISFDASTFELWGSLLNGAKLVIFPAEWSSLKELGQLIEDKGITTLWLTSALFSQMVEQQLHSLAGVRQLLAGGETLSVPHVRKMLTQPGNHRLINGYGPTENTTFTCCHVMTADSRVEESVPIGRPISNTSVYILDAQMNPVPIGVFGELYTGGEGVARGYLNQPSSDRFVDDPFSDVPGARLYNTGDMVRYRADGTIEFMGRRDQQVKIRGFRIELGEIEAALQDLPEVSQVVVMVREDDLSDKQMVAYIVGEYLTPDDLRIRLKKRLPEYMIPAAFVALPELPLTANGKIDRSALPGPKNEAVQSNKYLGPRNKLELHLVKIWESLLGTEPVGVTDDFFMLGGHSLLAARMFDEIQRLFGKKLPLDTLWFGGATIEHLAQVLDADESTVTWPTLIQIKEGGDRPPLFCVHTQGGNLFHYYDMANELAVDQPVYGLQAQGVYGREDFHHRIEDIAAHCIDTMRAKLPDGPYLITGFSSGGLVAFEMAQQLLKAGVPPAMLVLVDTFPPHIRRHGHYWNKIKEFIRLNKLRYLQERIYHAIMQPLHMDRFRKFSNSGEAHRWAQWSYRTKPYPGPVTLFMAEASNSQTRGSSLGWDQLTPSLQIYTIPGTHGMMVKPPHVTRLATLMQSLIDSSEITGNKHL